MRRFVLTIVLGLFLSAPAMAACDPWIVYGQTQSINQGAIDNPPPSVNGLRGEVAAFPYVVPEGKELIVTAYGLEAYGNVFGGLVLLPWIGEFPPTNSKGLHSVFSDNDSNETVGVRFHIPAGKKFNIRIMSNENPSQVVGWYVNGELCDAP